MAAGSTGQPGSGPATRGVSCCPGIAAWAALIAFGMDAWTPSRCAPRSRSRSRWRWRVLRPFAAWLYPARLSRSRPCAGADRAPGGAALRRAAEHIGSGPVSPARAPRRDDYAPLYWQALGRPTARCKVSAQRGIGRGRRDSIPATGQPPGRPTGALGRVGRSISPWRFCGRRAAAGCQW